MGSLMMMKFGDAGSLSFPDFDKILDFTSAGSESSVSVTVDGDVDKEYKIICRNVTGQVIYLRPNNATTNYGRQFIKNASGTISAGRDTPTYIFTGFPSNSEAEISLLTPTGFTKTSFINVLNYASGTTLDYMYPIGDVYNSTSNITSLVFVTATGNFGAGTRIIVYRRRVNT